MAVFAFMAANMISNPIVAGYALSLGAGAGMMSAIASLNAFSALITRPFLGNIADRVDKYKFTQAGLILMTIGALPQVLAPNALVLGIGRICLGLGFTLSSISLPAWLSSLVPENQIGRAIGIYGTIHAIGMALAPTLGILLYQSLGYRAAFVGMLIFAASAFVLLKCAKREKTDMKTEEVDADRKVIDGASKEAAKEKKKFRLVCAETVPVSCIAMFLCMPYCATQVYIVQYAEMKNIAVMVSLFFPVYASFLAVLRTVISKRVDRIPFRYFFWISMAGMVIFLCGMTVMKSNIVLCIMSLILAVSYGLINTICQSKAILLAGRGNEGIGNSTFYLGLDIGMTAGSMVGGVLITRLPVNLFYPSMLVLVPVCIIIYMLSIRKQNI